MKIRLENVPSVILRIIPHKSVLNSQLPKFHAQLHQLFDVRPAKSWTWKNPLVIVYRPAPQIQWVTRMAADPDGRRIEFFVEIPADYVDAFKTKLRNHEQWKRSTIEMVSEFDAARGKCDTYRLQYTRHNMFALNADHSKQTSPVRELLAVADELAPGEEITLFLECEAVGRMRWKKLATYAWDVWKKGGVPYRAGIDPLRLAQVGVNGLLHVVHEIKELVGDLGDAIQNSFFHEKATKREKKPPVIVNHDREEILVNGELSSTTKKKRNSPVFKTTLELRVTSDDRIRRTMLAKSVEAALDAVSGDNRLQAVKVNIRSKKRLNHDPSIMSIDEIAKLTQLPTSDVQQDFADALEANQRVEVDIPSVFLDSAGIFVGTTEVRGQQFPIHIPASNPDTLMTARAFVGSPRQGKDQAIINLIVESKRKHGIGAVIPDWIDERAQIGGHQRGMADAIRDSLPPDDVIDIDWGNFDWPVYFGLSGITKNARNARVAADRIAKELASFLMGEDIDLHTTREYLRDAAKVCGGDLLELRRLFVDAEYRAQKIEEMEATHVGDADMWCTFHEDMSDAQRAQIFAPVNVRLGEILNDEILKPIFGQRANTDVDFERWIREGKVVILRIPTREMSEMSAKLLAYFVLMVTFLTKLSMNGSGAMTWLPINEPHQVQTPGFIHFVKRLLVEGPKYRLAPIFAFHHLGRGHLAPELIDTLASASISWHLFYNSNVQTYEKVRNHIEPTFTPETAMKQSERFHFIAAGWRDPAGATQIPFMVKAPDLVKNRWGAQDNSTITLAHSQRYGRPIEEVLADFKRRVRLKKPRAEVAASGGEPAAANGAPTTKKQPPPHVFKKKSGR